MLLFFCITSYPAEIAHFSSPNRELSNFVRLMELYWSKIVDPSRSSCLKIVNWKRFERRNFLVLRPVLPKMHISNQLIPSYSRDYGWWRCGKENLSIPPEAHPKAQSSDVFLSFQAKKLKRAVIFWGFGQSCWNCRFKLPRSTAFERRMTCPSAAKKSCGSHRFVVGPGGAGKTALEQALSKAITFLS